MADNALRYLMEHRAYEKPYNPIGNALQQFVSYVKPRLAHPLNTLASEAQRFTRMSPEELTGEAINTMNPVSAGFAGIVGGGGKMAQVLDKLHPNVDAYLSEGKKAAVLSKIVVPEELRGQGVGSKFMDDLTRMADESGMQLALTPSSGFGGNKNKLTEWYKKYDFVPNKGKKADFEISESMRREPKAVVTETKTQELPYQIEHKPMTIQGGASPLHDLSSSFDDTIYGKDALQNYGSGDPREKDILRILRQTKGNPDAMVTIYRGAPESASGINAGDWVTLHPKVAQDYVDLAHENEGIPSKVFSMQVPASHITAWPDSLLEQGYYPK